MSNNLVRSPYGETHIHLQGAVPLATLQKLFDVSGWKDSLDNAPPQFMKYFQSASHLKSFFEAPGPDTLKSLTELNSFDQFIASYLLTLLPIKTPEVFQIAVTETIDSLSARGYTWVECTVAPREYQLLGLSLQDQVDILNDCAKSSDLEILWIVDPIRNLGPESAEDLLTELKQLPSCFEAITLGGNETSFKSKVFQKCYEKARDHGFFCSVHAGETSDYRAVHEALEYLKVDRIGHGISAVESPQLLQRLKELDTVLEICITSNLKTNAFRSSDQHSHPLTQIHDAQVLFTVNTDDPEIFGCTLEHELKLAQRLTGMQQGELLERNYQHSFVSKRQGQHR